MATRAADRRNRVDRRLARETRSARVQFAVAGALGLLTAAVVVAQAALLAKVISRAAVDHVPLSALGGSLLALAGVIAARALLAGGFEFSGRVGALGVMSELRGRLARRLLIERPGRSPDERTGELAAAAVQGVDSLESYYAGYLPSLVLATAVPIAVLAWVAPLDLAAALILAATIPVLIVFMILIGKGAQARTRSRWRSLALLSSHFLDVVRGLETLRAHRRESAQVEVIAAVGDRYRRETMGTLRIAFVSSLVLELCAMLGTALVAATIGVQLTAGELSLQAGLTVLLLAPELYAPLRAVGQQFHASADGLAAAERLLEVLDGGDPLTVSASEGEAVVGAGAEAADPGIEAPDPATEAPDPARLPLQFENVSYEYEGRAGHVLRDLDLVLEPGELVALLGASGAGKSTLAGLALRLFEPTAGRVLCGSVDLRKFTPEAWRRRVAWVPQRAMLFSGTVADNIALADPGAARSAIERAAHEAGLDPVLATLADGLDTRIGDGGRRLSAGQGQRVAVARAFLRDASLVVLDEPTANLDPESAAAIGQAIARLCAGRTTLLISHDRELAARAARVIELKDGRVRPWCASVAGPNVRYAFG